MKNKLIISSLILVAVIFVVTMAGCEQKLEVSATSVDSDMPSEAPCVKVFIENSGSMDGYMCDGSQLKDVVYDYVSDINRHSSSTGLFYINSAIIPYKGELYDYIKDLNPLSFKKAGGNRSNSDLGDILAKVLSAVDDTTVCIFVSDCILDLPSKDPMKFLRHCEIRIKDEVVNARKRMPDLGVEILKLSSDFDGRYFYPDGKAETLNDVKRPYYIWIFGDKNYLAKLNSVVPLSELVKYDLSGIAAFSNHSDLPFDIFNSALTGKVIMPVNGGSHAIIKADFRTSLQPDGIVQDKANYSFNNPAITVDGIYPISDPNSKYTHFIRFTIPNGTKVVQECLTFYTPKLPSWVSDSNDEAGTDVKGNIDKTTGIKYLVQGVADAYKDEKTTAAFNINVKRK